MRSDPYVARSGRRGGPSCDCADLGVPRGRPQRDDLVGAGPVADRLVAVGASGAVQPGRSRGGEPGRIEMTSIASSPDDLVVEGQLSGFRRLAGCGLHAATRHRTANPAGRRTWLTGSPSPKQHSHTCTYARSEVFRPNCVSRAAAWGVPRTQQSLSSGGSPEARSRLGLGKRSLVSAGVLRRLTCGRSPSMGCDRAVANVDRGRWAVVVQRLERDGCAAGVVEEPHPVTK